MVYRGQGVKVEWHGLAARLAPGLVLSSLAANPWHQHLCEMVYMYDAPQPDWSRLGNPWDEERRPPRGHPLIAWLVILAVAGFVIVLSNLDVELVPAKFEAKAEDVSQVLMRIQGRYIVGSRGLAGVRGRDLYDQKQVQALNTGGVGQRLRFVVLAGELAGPQEALARLDDLNLAFLATPEEIRAERILHRLYVDLDENRFHTPSVTPDDREFLKRQLGWFGELALAPDGHPDRQARERALAPARRTSTTLLLVVGVGIFLAIFGFIGLIVFLVLALNGSVPSRLGVSPRPKPKAPRFDEPVLLQPVDDFSSAPDPELREPVALETPAASANVPEPALLPTREPGAGSGGAVRPPGGGIYAETFAAWFVLFPLLQLLAAVTPLQDKLLLVFIAQLLSLFALFWPLLRGLSWRQVRADLGLSLGKNPLVEVLMVIPCYAMTLPLLVIGLLLTLLLVTLGVGGGPVVPVGQAPMPVHPLVAETLHADSWKLTQLFLLLVVGAPLVEELFFRGVFYRHLREATGVIGVGLSAFLSATVSSLIFAAIHPQGLAAIPVLMGLAYGFTLAREWRGTLLTPMLMHALHNGMIFLMLTMAVAE